MAQRAIIGINGSVAPFDDSLDKIRTSGIGAGSVTWVPDAATRCTSLNVTANGTYNAAQRGDYGYDYVTVSVPGTSVTGRDPDTGEEIQVGVDPETGDIIETVLPVEIRVTTPPTKTTYTAGETIDYSGIVVHAYSATGQDMGAVPFKELVFPVTTAEADGDMWTDDAGLNAMMIYYVPTWWHGITSDDNTVEGQTFAYTSALGEAENRPATLCGEGPGTLLVTRYRGSNYAACLAGDNRAHLAQYFNGPNDYGLKELYGWRRIGGNTGTAGYNAFDYIGLDSQLTNIPESTVSPRNVDPTTLHATQSLPVQWSRTGDGAVLETCFDIQVIPAGGDAA